MNFSHAFYVKPAARELVDAASTLAPDQRPALTGTVLDAAERPVEAALVTFYLADAPTKPVGAVYTDELGRFAFGPLEAGQLYHVTVFKASDEIRPLP